MTDLTELLTDAERAARFARLCDEAIAKRHRNGEAGIGTLAEKRLHALIKNYICPDPDCQEVKVPGTRFVSDLRIGNEAYEIQTGEFFPMQKKIGYYLNSTDWNVTVIHPIPVRKWISWIEPETLEITPPRRCPRAGREEEILAQLWGLAPYLGNPRLRFRVLLLEAQDYKFRNGYSKDKKKGAERYERVPVSLLGDHRYQTPSDFAGLIPENLPSPFTAKEFSKCTRLRGKKLYAAIHALTALSLITPAEKRGRAGQWRVAAPDRGETCPAP